MSKYWQKRAIETQKRLTTKSIVETERQLKKYYTTALNRTKGSFLSTYNKLLRTIDKGREPTPADLYKLDTYWQLQGELRQELIKLGDKQTALYNQKFMELYENVYNSMAIKDDNHFNMFNRQTAEQMINEIWVSDGKSWSQRIWNNTEKLQQALNDELINCVLTGADDKYLRQMLMSEFKVSYGRADSLIRTEMAHIQTKAAEQRYIDMGVKYVQIWADKDERRCDICGKLHTEVFVLGRDKIPIPAHTNCRCCIIPITKTQEGQILGLLGERR